MKAEELMIGDWVRVTNRIAKVHDMDRIVGVEFIDGGYDVFKIEELEPIPLTPEILEKNEFKKYHDAAEDVDTYMSNYFPFLLIEDNGRWSLSTYDSAPMLFFLLYIDYVHQLQHLLRLWGTIKQIKL